MDTTLIFNLAFLAAALLALLTGFFKGRKYVWHYSAARFIVVVIATIASILLSKLISRLVAGWLYGLISDGLLSDGMSELMLALPSASVALEALVSMILSIAIFYPVFIIVRAVGNAFSAALAFLLVKLTSRSESSDNDINDDGEEHHGKKHKKSKHALRATGFNPVGGLFGAVSAFLVLCIYLAPTAGALGTGGEMLRSTETVNSTEEAETEDSFWGELVKAASDNVGVKTVGIVGGDLIYSSLTSYRMNGETATLPKETDVFVSLTEVAAVISSEETDKTEAAASIRGFGDAFDRSVIIPTLMSEFVSGAATAWENGDSFCGIEPPASDSGALFTMFGDLCSALDGTNIATLKEDIKTVSEIIVILLEEDVFASEEIDPMAILEKEQATRRMLEEFLNNERLFVLIGSVTNMGIDMLGDSLGVMDTLDGAYDSLAASLGSLPKDDESLSASVASVFDSYGLAITEKSAEDLASALSDVHDRETAKSVLSSIDVEFKDLDGRVSSAKLSDNASFVRHSALVSADMLDIKASKPGDPKREANALSAVFASVTDLVSLVSEETNNVNKTIAKMGPILDSFASTETIGKEKTALLLTAILQSEHFRTSLGFKLMDATGIAKTVTDGADNESYTSLMASLASTVSVVMNASEGGFTEEEIHEMIETLTPKSTEAIKQLTSAEVLVTYGVSDTVASPAAALMSAMFENLSAAKESGLSDDQFAKEAAAVSDMMSIAMAASSETPGGLFGKGSKTGVTVTEYVDRAMDSDVISKTVVEFVTNEDGTLTKDPLATGREFSDADKTEFEDAFNAQLSGCEASEKAVTLERINALGALMNLDVSLNGDGSVSVA